MRLLVTGGAGFIGSYICEKYVMNGDHVICLDNFMNGNLSNIHHLLGYSNFELIVGDIRDEELVNKTMMDVDAVFHLAAQIHVDRSVLEPKLTYSINVFGTQTILEAARKHDTEKVINASTCEIYGNYEYVPIDENHPLNCPHPYGTSKIAADRMCKSYSHSYGMNILVPRFGNIFGPRQKDAGYGAALAIFTNRVLHNKPPQIYGDGLQTRDYTYIEDIVRLYDLLLNTNKKVTDTFNVGSGREYRILDLANKIIKIAGKDLKPVHVKPRHNELRRLLVNSSRAKELFGWEPATSVEDGLNQYVNWYRTFHMVEDTYAIYDDNLKGVMAGKNPALVSSKNNDGCLPPQTVSATIIR